MEDPHNRVSPNEMFEVAKQVMLDGREPLSNKEWAIIMNFVAYNVMREIAESVCLIFSKLYGCPLDDDTVKAIVAYQQMVKLQENAEMN